MPNSEDYIQMADGTWQEKFITENPSTLLTIPKSEGRFNKRLEDLYIHTSSLRSTTNGLKVIIAREAIDESINAIGSLWHSFFYERSITLLSSVAGIGKTTFCYNLAMYGSKGESFGNVAFSKPVNTLYADLETSTELRKTKLNLISNGLVPDNLYFLNALDFIRDYAELKDIVLEHRIDLLIVDTINEAFHTRDEQDNAEANKQMCFVKSLRDETGCSILLLAHIGKGEQSHKAYAVRGASARAAVVDVVLNLTELTEDEICLSKEKDRLGGGKEKLYLKKAGDDFEVIERHEDHDINQLIKAEKLIIDLIDKGLSQTRQFIDSGKSEGYSDTTIERALSNLTKTDKITRLKKGLYGKSLPGLSENPSVFLNYSGFMTDSLNGVSKP